MSYDLRIKSKPKPRRLTPVQEEMAVQESAQRIQQVRASKLQPKDEKVPLGQTGPDPFTQTSLVPRPGRGAGRVFVVSVDKNIVPNHSDIDRPEFLSFIREFVMTYADPN